MAKLRSKVLFITTSPRTPEKMVPEIELLHRNFNGQVWNNETQKEFMHKLKDEDFFYGRAENDPAFSARDRINRAPKALGFVVLNPVISLTPAGLALVSSKRREEVFLRQLLKFQLPSPYHKASDNGAAFRVKPYLEIFRLIRHFGTLRFDELRLFALQLTDYRQFDNIVWKIDAFRVAKAKHQGSYKDFLGKYSERELRAIYSSEISQGNTATRESRDTSVAKFLETKGSNMRDYADACIRYLRATGMVNISHVGKSLSIIREKMDEVDFFLENTCREPCFEDDLRSYIDYLGDASLPVLLTDDRDRLLIKLRTSFPNSPFDADADIETLKELYHDMLTQRKQEALDEQTKELKDYKLYDDIQQVYGQIRENSIYDTPLMLEWNTWRAMTMLDGGNVKANLSFDDFGKPLSTAQGNMADIVCDYGDFGLSVEVTMSSGQRQFETEGEPVARHLGKLKTATGKPFYCLFIAPKINDACIALFYTLHKTNIAYYGGTSTIIPLPLDIFQKMVEDSHKASHVPEPRHVKRLFEYSNELAISCHDEKTWYGMLREKALSWLVWD